MNTEEYKHVEEFYKAYGLTESENYKNFDPFLTTNDYSDDDIDMRIDELKRYWYEYGTD